MDLTTARLMLREFEGSDSSRPLPAGLTAGEPTSVQQFDFRDPEGVRRQIASALESAREEPRRTFDLAVVLRANGQVIGRAFCFKELKLHRVWGECNPKNAAAVKGMEALGLRREGHLLENAWRDGWQDTAIYALLDREFR
jgi:RimJ/RimL family protein N-acetyltransferase